MVDPARSRRAPRWRWATVTAAAALAVGLAVAAPAYADDTAAQRADAAFASLQYYLGASDGSNLYREHYPSQSGDQPYSYEWPLSQAHVAILDLDVVDAKYDQATSNVLTAQEHYWEDTSTTGKAGYASYPVGQYGGGGGLFYDDNEWAALAAMERYLQNGDQSALSRAEQVFDLVVSGWDGNGSDPSPGGVFWTQSSDSGRNTVSNMPGALLGLRLYQATNNQYYKDWALKMYDWTNSTLLAPNGLYYDSISPSGSIDQTQWSYNQGVPIGVNVVLYQITKDHTYLDRAQAIADAATNYYIGGGRLAAQGITFNAIFFKNLLLLASQTGNTAYLNDLTYYANTVWAQNVDSTTHLVRFDGESATDVIEQASLVQLFALQLWTSSQWAEIT